MTDCSRDDAQTPEALECLKQEYLLEKTLQNCFRVLYGDSAVNTTKRIAHELAKELVVRGVVIIPIVLLLWECTAGAL